MEKTPSFSSQPHWDGPFRPVRFAFLVLGPLATAGLAAAYVLREGFQFPDFLSFAVMASLTGISITAGYHRLLAHRAYRCHPAIKAFYLIFGAAAMENSAHNWCSDHRYHHRFVDTDGDPYNAKRGFFWAHMGWIFYDEAKDRTFDNIPDLRSDAWIQWQHRWYWPLLLAFGFLLPTLIGLAWGRPLGGLIWGGLARMFVLHHSTYLINSAAHFFGSQPYSTRTTARDSWWVAFISLGEGYHNFHHAFASDYRNGVRWWAFDPSKWLIYLLSRVGLAWNLRRAPEMTLLRMRAETMTQESSQILEELGKRGVLWSEGFKAQLEQICDRIRRAAADFEEARGRYRAWLQSSGRTRRIRRADRRLWKEQLRAYRAAVFEAWEDLSRFARTIKSSAYWRSSARASGGVL